MQIGHPPPWPPRSLWRTSPDAPGLAAHTNRVNFLHRFKATATSLIDSQPLQIWLDAAASGSALLIDLT